ncbi:hypothetical protein PSTG_16899 [Puccinia striiformis f. sp. tritici PST-78]|uniref:CxC1-like cysteine cluster associated with KDZ transposases domain-containing protein n=1 Tax=Puccinia striiformis f. sp. tritici PST-78 TaxID=1165861 RepID=A0A0L0URP0_9BASI|nr:hypothetical protein PSTG_16899 [Puccinia striiformis f. sp. tritici PST-78]
MPLERNRPPTRPPKQSRSTPAKPARTNRINPFKHKTENAKKLCLRNQEREAQSLQRLQALHRGELPLPSSTQALNEYLQATKTSNQTTGLDNGQSALWDEFDDGEWETYEVTSAPLISSISQTIYDFNASRRRARLVANWDNNIPHLHGVYMWLKVKTGNWTFDSSFESYEDQFCKCTQFTYRTVDVFDLMWQKQIRQRFCKCIPDVVRLLTLGFVGSSPIHPKTAFLVRLLQFHNLLWQWCSVATFPFTEMLSRWLEERSERILNAEETRVAKVFLSSGQHISSLAAQDQRCSHQSSPANQNPNLSVIVLPRMLWPEPHRRYSQAKTVNGNFQHRHNAKAGSAAPPTIHPIFLDPKLVAVIQELIDNLASITEPTDACSDSHKAANDKRSESTWKGCDDTGLMGCCCCHDQVVSLANIHRSGEKRCLPLALIKKLFDDLESTRPVGVLYDIGCSLKKFLDLRDYFAFPLKKNQSKFGTSVFHAYVHEWKCQVKFNPRYNIGWGLSDGEGLERLWSSLSPLVRTLRYSSRNHRLAALSHRCQFLNSEGRDSIILWLRNKYSAAKFRRRQDKATLAELLQQPNPFLNDGSNYTREFFMDQWKEQLEYLENVTNDEIAKRKKLTKLLGKELSLKKLRDVLAQRDWDIQAELMERITQEISETESTQRELAVQIGGIYSTDAAEFAKQRSKLLIWGAMQELYAKAVDIKGVYHPISKSRTRGRRVGTKVKEKIFKSINKRMKVVLRIIEKYNQHKKEFLVKYDPNTLFVALTWDAFKALSLDDPFWNDVAYCGSQAPWAVSMDVREGIRTSHMVDWAEEELDMITQELGQALTWAVELNSQLDTLATRIYNSPPDSNKVVTSTRVGTLDQLTITPEPITDPAPEPGSEELDEALQEEEFLDEADDGEIAPDENADTSPGGEGWQTDDE